MYKSGPIPMSSDHVDYKNSYWTARQQMTVLDKSSEARNTSDGGAASMLDGSRYSSWETLKGFSEYATFDLGDSRWITGLRIQGLVSLPSLL